MEIRTLSPSVLSGKAEVPVSKSEAQRALLLAGLSAVPFRIDGLGLPFCDDAAAAAEAVKAIGCRIVFDSDAVVVLPAAHFVSGPVSISVRASATLLRMLVPVLWSRGIPAILHLHPTLCSRPMSALQELARQAGTVFRLDLSSGKAEVSGTLKPGTYMVDGTVSSQFAGGMLMALASLDKPSDLTVRGPVVSRGYLNLTVSMLRSLGHTIREEGDVFHISPSPVPASRLSLNRDWSQAAALFCANALGTRISVRGLRTVSLQPDSAVVCLLQTMGMVFAETGDALTCIRPNSSLLSALDADLSSQPDLLPFLALACTAAEGVSVLRGAGRLRLKESDRLEETLLLLGRMGVKASYLQAEDAIMINGPARLHGDFSFDARQDHRMAMLCALGAACCDQPVFLSGADSVSKSWPDFWTVYHALGGIFL